MSYLSPISQLMTTMQYVSHGSQKEMVLPYRYGLLERSCQLAPSSLSQFCYTRLCVFSKRKLKRIRKSYKDKVYICESLSNLEHGRRWKSIELLPISTSMNSSVVICSVSEGSNPLKSILTSSRIIMSQLCILSKEDSSVVAPSL